jgi:hypothetical protein
MLDSNDVLVATDVGVFRSTDGGATFEPFMDGLPEGLVVTDLKLDPPEVSVLPAEAPIKRVTAGTYGRGAWQVHLGPFPGTVPPTTLFRRIGSDVEAAWEASCNAESVEQTYSIQAGDLDLLRASGTYSHAPVGGVCTRTSPSIFTPGSGNEYYLVVPNAEGREGGHGSASSGTERPRPSTVCGEPLAVACD